jgi:hypothetical protein
MSNASKDFLGGGVGPKSASFKTLGDSITGTVGDMEQTQQTTPDGTLKVWPRDGSPMMQLVIHLQTQLHEDDDDDGVRRLFVNSYNMKLRMQEAVAAVGAEQLDEGGTLTVTYISDGERGSASSFAPKQYVVSYVPPNASAGFLGGSGNGAAAATAVAVQPAGQLPEGLPEGMTLDIWNKLSPEAQASLLLLAK